MSPSYISEVRRFGSKIPYMGSDGRKLRLSHEDIFTWDDVETDGVGNVTKMPLQRRKPCFGRPERVVRGATQERKWVNDDGDICWGETTCDRCPVLLACVKLADERIESSQSIKTACCVWWDACESKLVSPGSSHSFLGELGVLWGNFLQAIIHHGGWSNTNDEQVRLDNQRREALERQKKNAARRHGRKRESAKRRGKIQPITEEFLAALQNERDRRADQLKRLRSGPAAGPSFSRLPDAACERIADVWQARELLKSSGEKPTGTAIADLILGWGRSSGLTRHTLISRVCENLRIHLATLEDDRGGAPVWTSWNYCESPPPRRSNPVEMMPPSYEATSGTP